MTNRTGARMHDIGLGTTGTGNHAMLEALVASFEGAEAAVACASGMGATTAWLLGLLSAGDHVVAARDLYGATGPVVNAVTQAWTAVGVN